jgi:hypothetical protein
MDVEATARKIAEAVAFNGATVRYVEAKRGDTEWEHVESWYLGYISSVIAGELTAALAQANAKREWSEEYDER